uniref:ER membrane protein complex subunit 3 n=1 Tax=Fundulus heteroclitus TaxID=8078 RepID=A0A3Q2PHE8_FUNHE
MAGPELLLDSSIRMWVVLPIVFITFFVGVLRHYVSQLLHSDKKVDLEQVSDSQVLLRSRVLRENGKYIPRQSFAMRKHYFNHAETGFFKTVKRKVVPKNPMTGVCVFPLILFKSGSRTGCSLTDRFCDVCRVSSASWYFLNVFGLRSMYALILGQDNAADQSRMMQDQMTGAAMAMPPDPNKAFKSEWEALEVVSHNWALENVEEELVSGDLNFGNLFSEPVGLF